MSARFTAKVRSFLISISFSASVALPKFRSYASLARDPLATQFSYSLAPSLGFAPGVFAMGLTCMCLIATIASLCDCAKADRTSPYFLVISERESKDLWCALFAVALSCLDDPRDAKRSYPPPPTASPHTPATPATATSTRSEVLIPFRFLGAAAGAAPYPTATAVGMSESRALIVR